MPISSEQIQDFITNHPNGQNLVASYITEWDNFLSKYAKANPELLQITTIDQAPIFFNWLRNHPEVDPSLWKSFEVKDAYIHTDLSLPGETEHIVHTGRHVAIHGGIGRLIENYIKRVVIEENMDYKKVVEEEKAKWLKKNNQKDFFSKEGLDFLYGSLDETQEETLHKKAHEAFKKQYQGQWQQYEKYSEKIYKNLGADPIIEQVEVDINTELLARMDFFKKSKIEFDPKELKEKIEAKHWKGFATRFPKKAQVYRNYIHPKTKEKSEIAKAIDAAVQRVETTKTQRYLKEYQEKTGKEVKLTEKIHRKPQAISVETPDQVADRLAAMQANFKPTSPLIVPSFTRRPTPLPLVPNIPPPEPTAPPPQPPSPQSNQRGGGTNLINSANDLINNGRQIVQMLKNVQKLAQIAKIGALFFNPVFWIILGVVLVLLIVFIIVFNTGKSSSGSEISTEESRSSSAGSSRSTIISRVAGLTLSIKVSPDSLLNGPETVRYTIIATYVGDKKIMIYDPLPPTLQYLESLEPLGEPPQEEKIENSVKLTWFLDKFKPQESVSREGKPQKTYIFTFTAKPKANDIEIDNTIYGELAEGETTGEIMPSGDDCGKLYRKFMNDNTPTRLNYGDPTCELRLPNGTIDKNKIASFIFSKTQNNKEEAFKWFTTVFFESTYNANALLHDSASKKGAYGLLQMNPVGKGNGIYDRGDVVWRQQIENALNYNERILGSKKNMCYWQPAICLGYSTCEYKGADYAKNCKGVDASKGPANPF